MKNIFIKLARKRISINPKTLFLIDAVGALFSAFMLGVVLVQFESIFGIPQAALYLLSIIPCFFVLYDLACYSFIKNTYGPFLKLLALLNGSYCILSLGLAVVYSDKITIYGWCYLLIEIAI
ncbi:MAG: hypothetical protein AAF717_12370 [Bacteroidota bacterium]